MSESTKKKWVPVAGTLVAVIGSIAALIYLDLLPTIRAQIPSTYARVQPFDSTNENTWGGRIRLDEIQFIAPEPGWTKALLRCNQDSQMGRVVLTYRGLNERSMILLDAMIPELDPHFAYSHTIPVSRAKKGFQAGGERFVLLSASQSKILMLHHSTP